MIVALMDTKCAHSFLSPFELPCHLAVICNFSLVLRQEMEFECDGANSRTMKSTRDENNRTSYFERNGHNVGSGEGAMVRIAGEMLHTFQRPFTMTSDEVSR